MLFLLVPQVADHPPQQSSQRRALLSRQAGKGLLVAEAERRLGVWASAKAPFSVSAITTALPSHLSPHRDTSPPFSSLENLTTTAGWSRRRMPHHVALQQGALFGQQQTRRKLGHRDADRAEFVVQRPCDKDGAPPAQARPGGTEDRQNSGVALGREDQLQKAIRTTASLAPFGASRPFFTVT
jgi:hypothetical protein